MADELFYNRTGGPCNRCGRCCGAPGGPDRRTPFPKIWPDRLEGLPYQEVVDRCPILVLMGVLDKGDGTTNTPNRHGSTRYTGGGPARTYYWVWVPGVGVCKDTSLDHDGSSYEPQCPFLLDDPGDGTRPCGLVGEADEWRFDIWCLNEPTFPREERFVDEWRWRYGEGATGSEKWCSYTWEPD